MNPDTPTVYDKLKALNITLPAVSVPAAAYLPFVQTGKLEAAVGLGQVKRIVKVLSLVNSSADFTDHHLVTNGASELLVEVFGDAGKHARSAFGVAQIPMGACVEIELIAEIN